MTTLPRRRSRQCSRNDSLAYFVPRWNKSDNVVSPFRWCTRQTVPPSSVSRSTLFTRAAWHHLYGYHTLPAIIPAPDLRPVLSLQTTIVQLRRIPRGERSATTGHLSRNDRRVSVLPIAMPTAIVGGSPIADRLDSGTSRPDRRLVCMDMIWWMSPTSHGTSG